MVTNLRLPEAATDISARQHKPAAYVPAYASPVSAAEQQERLAMLQRIPQQATAALTRLTVPNYHVDRTVREAILAPASHWREKLNIPFFTSSEQLTVHLGTPRAPLRMREAVGRIRELRISTLLTARIVLGLWTLRRANHQLAKNGSVALRLEEVLQWRGVKKQSYLVPAGEATHRYTDGYKYHYKEQVLKDLDLLASCCIEGQVTCTFKGKKVQASINAPYLQYSPVTEHKSEANERVVGVFVSPGAWIDAYAEYDNYFLTEIDRAILQLNPHQQKYELRLALYLSERWRQLGREGKFEQAISMMELLSASMIDVDKANLTSRFAPRIEQALETLWQRGVLGAPPRRTSPLSAQAYWGHAWLASQWILLPSLEIHQFYEATLHAPEFHDSSRSSKAGARKKRVSA